MSDPHDFRVEEQKGSRRTDNSDAGLAHDAALERAWEGVRAYPPLSLGRARLDGHSNAPARAAIMLNAQQTSGNKAVQRVVQRQSDAVRSHAQVQRSLWDDASDWASENVGRNPIDMFGAAHGLNQVFGEQHSTGPDGERQSRPSRFYGALRSAESTVMGGVNSLADRAADVPVLGSVAGWGAEFIGNRAQQATGFIAGAGDFVGGLANMADNPMQTLGSFQQIAENNLMTPGFLNPFRAAHAAYDVATGRGDLSKLAGDAAHRWLDPAESMRQSGEFMTNMAGGMLRPYGQALSEGRGYEAVGRLGFDILSNMTGGGEANAANRGARAARAAEVAGATARGAEVAGATARGAEVASGLSHGAGGAAHNVPRPTAVSSPHAPAMPSGTTPHAPAVDPFAPTIEMPQVPQPHGNPGISNPVMQMPAVPTNIHPGMPQPPRWQPGPVGTPPISNPVREMPAITPQQAASGQMPRDWGVYPVGRGRMPGQVGEMPVVGSSPGLREPAGFGNNAGAVSPRSSAPGSAAGAPAPAQAPGPLQTPPAPTPARNPTPVDPIAPTDEIGRMGAHDLVFYIAEELDKIGLADRAREFLQGHGISPDSPRLGQQIDLSYSWLQ